MSGNRPFLSAAAVIGMAALPHVAGAQVATDPARLEVNLVSGQIHLINVNPADAAEIGSYEITSAGNSLDASKWLSLADQATAPGWSELIAQDGYVAENTNAATASSAVPAGGFNLGPVFRPGRPQDLSFLFGDEQNQTFEGAVVYTPEPTTVALVPFAAAVLLLRRRRQDPVRA